MGQYYRPVVGDVSGKDITVYGRSVDGKYVGGAKLMEHSWIGNPCMECVAKLLYKNPQRLAWIGDYAKQSDFEGVFKAGRHIEDSVAVPDVEKVWEIETPPGFKSDERIDFLDHKYFVNHEQKKYLDIDEYRDRSALEGDDCIHPISLLTAIGNGRGGGDFFNRIQMKFVGIWSWNLVSVEDEPLQGFEKDDKIAFSKYW